ncbi:hypothetical protein FB45DRAFT_1068431 [Roridomyces roridus]|uniref:SAM domain-containing protein n=1 Tax=Roridomyces roridus TaxID=1738132 RepID=A0AAD7B0E1_9AGAR|nr:hypothetical protein FB45DRAFT_1068431 [Roridomyces roridus]
MASEEPEPEPHSMKVISIITFHTVTATPTASTKEFTYVFENTSDNYIPFLKLILSTHGEQRYRIGTRFTFSIKAQLPSVKKGEALDIDTEEEYKALVKAILTGLPAKLTVYVDQGEIQKKWKQRKDLDEDSDNEDIDGEDPSLNDSNGLSELDRALARFREILEKRWQNDHDAGYMYIDPDTGTSYPLTPQMMKEWSRAMYNGESNQNAPPEHLVMFNTAHRKTALHPSRIAAGVNQPAPTSDLGHLASILTTVLGHAGLAPKPAPAVEVPATPARTAHHASPASPALPTPSKLPRFLEYASRELGVPNARQFEFAMNENGYGPDILHRLEDRDLTDLGMTKGDAMRLKAGAAAWWEGPHAKRKRASSDVRAGGGFPGSRCHDEGGAERFYGPRIVNGYGEANIFYRCPIQNKFVLVPLGYRATTEEEIDLADGDTEMDLYNPPNSQSDERNNAAQTLAGLANSS